MAGKSFKGNLEILNLSDIFQSLAMNRHSGTLIVNDGKREKKIYFAEGEVTLLSSSRRQRLGELLISSGKITAEDLDLALKLQKQSRKKLGEILVEEGFCEDKDIFDLVRKQIEEEIYDLFLWRKADFEFIADSIPEDMAREAPNLTRLSLNTNGLIMEALRRLDEWNLLQDLVPSTKEVFVVEDAKALATAVHHENVKPELIDGKTTVEGLAEKFFMSDFECCKTLAELVQQGAIRALTQDQLVEKGEEAYALNDFAAAAALYGRLTEYHPGQPKILIPLADSLRRSGADRQALTIYDDLVKTLEAEGGREPDRLRQCYEAITQLDPSRQDAARKLEELDLSVATAPTGRRCGPIVIVLAIVIAGAGALFKDRIIALWKPPVPDDSSKRSAELLEEMSRAKAARRYKEWFEKGVALWTEFPEAPQMRKVELPLLVSTEPAGYEVYVNDLFQNQTTDEGPLVCTFLPSTRVRVDIKVPKREGREQVVLFTHTFEDAKAWHEVAVALMDEPDASLITDFRVDQPLVRAPSLDAWLTASRDGALRAITAKPNENGKLSLAARDGWDGAKLGEKGDTVTPPVLANGRMFVGLPEGGLVALDLAAANGADGVRRGQLLADGPVVAEPVVVGERVILGSLHGEVIAYPLNGGSPAWTLRTEGGVAQPLRSLPEKGLVLVVGEDARLYAVHAQTGQLAWTHEAEATIDGPAVPLPGGIGLTLQTGKLILVDSTTGTALPQSWADPEKRRITVVRDAEGKRLVVATQDGVVRALDPTTLQPLWPTEFTRKMSMRPRMAFFGERLIIAGDGPTGSETERPHVWGVDAKTGRLVWQGRFPERAGRVIAITSADKLLLLSTTKNYLHVFDAEDHGP